MSQTQPTSSMRKGKTSRDRANGAFQQNAQNKAARAAWCQSSNRTQAGFPSHTCNGKKSRALRGA